MARPMAGPSNVARACQQLLALNGSEGAWLRGDLVPLWGYLTWDSPAVRELPP